MRRSFIMFIIIDTTDGEPCGLRGVTCVCDRMYTFPNLLSFLTNATSNLHGHASENKNKIGGGKQLLMIHWASSNLYSVTESLRDVRSCTLPRHRKPAVPV